MDKRMVSTRLAISSDMAKSTTIQLRVTEAQKERLKGAADAAGLTLSEFILEAAQEKVTGAGRKGGRTVTYARIGKEEIPVNELLKVPVIVRSVVEGKDAK
jgi:hypothetical protein